MAFWRMTWRVGRQWLTAYYAGDKRTQEWKDLWVAGESIDLTLEQIHVVGGYAGVCAALESDDRLEAWLTRISAQVTYLLTGEKAMLDQLQSSQPPGAQDLAPSWAISAARDSAKALYQQQGRMSGRRTPGDGGGGGGQEGSGRRARRRRGAGGGVGDGAAGQGSKPSEKPKG